MTEHTILPDADDAAPKKGKNRAALWIGLIVLFLCLGATAFVVWFVINSGGISMPEPQATRTAAPGNPTTAPTSAFNGARETATPQPGNPTATPNDLGVSPQVFEMIQFGFRTSATPVPGAGPSVNEAPKVPKLQTGHDDFTFIREYINQYRDAAKKLGKETSLYDVTDNIIVWIYTVERDGAGKCSVTTEGGVWYNANLESCKGLDLTITNGQAFVMAELADTRVDNSAIKVTPFYNGSTMGRWGLWLAEDTTLHLTTGLVYIPAGTEYTVKPVTFK